MISDIVRTRFYMNISFINTVSEKKLYIKLTNVLKIITIFRYCKAIEVHYLVKSIEALLILDISKNTYRNTWWIFLILQECNKHASPHICQWRFRNSVANKNGIKRKYLFEFLKLSQILRSVEPCYRQYSLGIIFVSFKIVRVVRT